MAVIDRVIVNKRGSTAYRLSKIGQPEGCGDGVLPKVNEPKGVVPGTAQEQMALCDKKERERERDR